MTSLPQAARDVVKTHSRQIKEPFDLCFTASHRLAQALTEAGCQATLIQFQGLLLPAPDADPRWRRLPPETWSHYAVLAGDVVIDLTWQQFFPDAPQPHLLAIERAKEHWSRCYA